MELNPDQYANIMATLATLTQGIGGINDHLERLNSKVATHEGELNTIMLWKAQALGFGQAIGIGWSILISLISGLGGGIIYWLLHR